LPVFSLAVGFTAYGNLGFRISDFGLRIADFKRREKHRERAGLSAIS